MDRPTRERTRTHFLVSEMEPPYSDDGLWPFVRDGRSWTVDEHGPSTSWTDSDDVPLKI